MTCKGIFNNLPYVPVWTNDGENCICTDAKTGKLLQINKIPQRNGKNMEFFERYEVKTLIDVGAGKSGRRKLKSGSTAFVEINLAGQIYMYENKNDVLVIKVDAEEHIHFEFV